MSELRRDPIVGRWVIINTDHPLGPNDFEKEDQSAKQAAVCQFCSGRESQTPGEVESIRLNGSLPNTAGWSLRVVPNKFPALQVEGEIDKRGIGIFDMAKGIGAHEVVIETPDHHKNLADFSDQEILSVIKTYQSRLITLAKDKRFKYIMIFKNYGESAGASLEHAHTQILALPLVPKYVLEELEGAQYYYEYRGRCVFCDMIEQEYQDKKRIITENNDFISFAPFVPRFPFESWIIPKKHGFEFCSLAQEGRHNLAMILREVLYRMKKCLSDPSYNFYLHLAPLNNAYQDSYHWHIEIIPKLTRVAGFEWGTGFYVVETEPGVAAQHLREVVYSGV
ncbi:MAG: galactose-1-phosphate uridylyltransferase [Candidatus Omnitrophota bacterium]